VGPAVVVIVVILAPTAARHNAVGVAGWVRCW
jgi:hypothetical protein